MSLNGYAFCGNDPINRIDPSGHAYIVKETKTKRLSNRRVTHTDTGYDNLVSQGKTASAGKIISSVIPYGDIASKYLEYASKVVGGKSSTSQKEVNVGTTMELAKKALESVKKLEKIAEKVKTLSVLMGVYNTGKALDLYQMDKTMFTLLNRTGITTRSKSLNYLTKVENNSYSFIAANSAYFSIFVNGGDTFFNIDLKIESKPQKQREVYVNYLTNEYKSNLISNGQFNNLNANVKIFKDYLWDFDDRLKTVEDAFKSFVLEDAYEK